MPRTGVTTGPTRAAGACGRSRRAAPEALAAQAHRLHQHLRCHPDLGLTDVAYSLATTRTHHPYRATITTHCPTGIPARTCWMPWMR